jgi:MFS family permease
MLIAGIALGLVLGLLLGGRLDNLAEVRLRFLPLLFVAVIVRFATEGALGLGVGFAEDFRVPLLAAAYGILLFALWPNRGYPGLALAFVGILSNAIVILVNGGRMPVWMPAYDASGIEGPLSSVLHVAIPGGSGPEFFARLGLLGDVIPIPVWPVNNVASVGDLFLTGGLAFFLFATLMRAPASARTAIDEAGSATATRSSGTGLAAGFGEAAALERPLVLGSSGVGMASPALTLLQVEAPGGLGGDAIAVPVRRPGMAERVREHPYVRLALNGSFSALWMGQLISLFGDRVNQLALAAFVFEVTDSAFALALTFLVATLPNLVFSPIAGVYVDRWDKKQVLVVSDILRAALVLLVPVAVLVNVWLAYPLVFLITTVSIFFRPARIAILPRIVPERDLLSANSALWVGETVADVINYPIAGLFVVFLAGSLPIAFWFDAATYLVSAALLAAIVVPPLLRRARPDDELGPDGTLVGAAPGEAAATPEQPSSSLVTELKEGWAFLRHETVLLANTLQGTAGQFAVGVVTVASLVLAREITTDPGSAYRGTWAFMETAIGLGNLIGGFALGLLTMRVRKGLLVIAAYTGFGALVFLLGVVSSIPLVLGILFGVGVANMAFVIPSQTLFQERTPPELMGRVVSFRFALVFGGMSIAMGVGGLFVGALGPGPVIAAAGIISMIAGLSGLAVKAVREA